MSPLELTNGILLDLGCNHLQRLVLTRRRLYGLPNFPKSTNHNSHLTGKRKCAVILSAFDILELPQLHYKVQ